MTRLDPPATAAEDAAAAAMWAIWGLGGNVQAGRTWDTESDVIRDMWRTYARAALAATPPMDGAALAFVRGVADMVGDELDAHASSGLRDAARAVIASEPAAAGVSVDAGSADSRYFLDRILVDGECVAFADEPWTSTIASALADLRVADWVRKA